MKVCILLRDLPSMFGEVLRRVRGAMTGSRILVQLSVEGREKKQHS